MSEQLRWQFKVCLIGDGFVGKTSIRRKYLGQVFKTNYIPTLGVDFANKTMDLDGLSVRLVIWDIAGQEAFSGLRRRYYEGCAGMILAYSVVDRESFDNASKWLVEAHGFLGGLPPLIIAANKVDLRPSYPPEDVITSEEGQAFAKMFGEKLNTPAVFIETSAVTGENIEEAFRSLCRLMIRQEDSDASAEEKPEELAEMQTTPVVTVEANSRSEAVPEQDFVQEAQIGLSMTELVDLKAKLKAAESDLAEFTTGKETALLNLRNTIHVKRIMYEHLKKQITETREAWSEAYEEYMKIDREKKSALDAKMKAIESLRKRIGEIEGTIGKQIRDLRLETR